MPCYCVKDKKGNIIRTCGECLDKSLGEIKANITEKNEEKSTIEKPVIEQ